MKFDYVVAGAGFSGCVLAERIATVLDMKVLVVDRRDHIGGNAYDYHDGHGILVHKYGPHIFHTNSDRVWHYLSRFTTWRPYEHRVLASVDGRLVPVPFNLASLHALFPPRGAARLEQALIRSFGRGARVPVLELRRHPDPEVADLAEFVYAKVFEGYTRKQWGLDPAELDPSVTARVPVLVSRDDRYFQDTYQGMPAQGYTELFRRMLQHRNITVRLGTDHREFGGKLIYTGRADEFFGSKHGPLQYRSLRFDLRHETADKVQPVATLNFPNEFAFTRATEFKQLTGQTVSGTVRTFEYPEPYELGRNEPCYPIPTAASRALFARYRQEIEELSGRVVFCGRLADYQYYNMDQAVARALTVFERDIAGLAAA